MTLFSRVSMALRQAATDLAWVPICLSSTSKLTHRTAARIVDQTASDHRDPRDASCVPVFSRCLIFGQGPARSGRQVGQAPEQNRQSHLGMLYRPHLATNLIALALPLEAKSLRAPEWRPKRRSRVLR